MDIVNPDIFRINIVKQLNEFIENEKISINLEKAIFNHSIKESKVKKIVKKWNNKYFVQLYMDKLKSIMNNIRLNHNIFINKICRSIIISIYATYLGSC